MRRRGSRRTAHDLFCGAGGSTLGAQEAGLEVIVGSNHWKRACETYGLNHPNTRVDCADISATDPRRYPSADVLIASPECTTHSPAKGRKPERTLFDDSPPGIEELERSRVTMWDVVRFAEYHLYDLVVVENVVEIRRWLLFDTWLQAMLNLGYRHQEVYLNSMVAHPTPQSRDRIYIVFWREKNKAPDLRFDVRAWCEKHGDVMAIQSWKNPTRPRGKYRQQYLYRCPTCAGIALPYAYPAASAIDWSLTAPRIGDRTRPLADATMARIRAGLERYGPQLIVAAAGNTWERRPGVRAWPLGEPIPTQATTAQHALVVDTAYDERGPAARPTWAPLGAQTARQTKALVVPLRTHGKAAPAERSVFPTVVAGNAGHALLVPAGGTWNDTAVPVDRPFRARTGSESEGVFIVKNYTGRPADMVQGIEDPLGTVTAQDHHAVVSMPFLVPYNRTGAPWPVEDPMGTVDTRDRRALVMPEIEIDDCGFRMLKPHEIGRAMAFPETYTVLGNEREQTRQYGNAVTPPVMDLLIGRGLVTLN